MERAPDPIEPHTTRRALAYMTLVFAAVHGAFYLSGGRFVPATLQGMMHFMDPELLKHRLWETCFYLHIQPPLMNLLVGLGLKLPEALGPVAFHVAFLAFGLVLYWAVFLLQLRLGVSRRVAAIFSTWFMASPSFLLYEHWLFYTMPCAMMLALAALFLFNTIETRRSWAMAAFFVTLFCLCATRSMFHLYYFAVVLFATAYACKGNRKRVIAIAAIPFLLVFSVYFKNYVLFGKFTACTFAGKNLWITTVGNMGWPDRERLILEGKLSDLSRINRWSSVDEYPPEYRHVRGFEGIPALCQVHKSTGAPNYNHMGEIAICEQYGNDARYVLVHEPKQFLAATAVAWYRYFRSSAELPVSARNSRVLRAVTAVYDRLFYGKLPLASISRLSLVRTAGPPYVFLFLSLVAAFAYGLYAAFARADRGRGLTRSQRITVLFLCFNILYVAVLGCTFDVLETCRYRFMTDGLSVALLGLLIQRASESYRRWAKRHGADHRASAQPNV